MKNVFLSIDFITFVLSIEYWIVQVSMNQHKVSFFLYFVAFLCGVFALLFFDSIRMIVNVVIGLCGAQNSSIVGVNWLCVVLGVCVCVCSTRFSAAEKKCAHSMVLNCGQPYVSFGNNRERETDRLSAWCDFWNGVRNCEHRFYRNLDSVLLLFG